MSTAASSPAPSPAPNLAQITALVHDFYADVRADPVLGPVFEQALHERWEPHLQRMVDFWSTIALGDKRYSGNVFAKHMALSGIAPEHFAAWVRLWGQHTERLFSPDVAHELQSVAHGIARNLYLGYFGTRPVFSTDPPEDPHALPILHGTSNAPGSPI